MSAVPPARPPMFDARRATNGALQGCPSARARSSSSNSASSATASRGEKIRLADTTPRAPHRGPLRRPRDGALDERPREPRARRRRGARRVEDAHEPTKEHGPPSDREPVQDVPYRPGRARIARTPSHSARWVAQTVLQASELSALVRGGPACTPNDLSPPGFDVIGIHGVREHETGQRELISCKREPGLGQRRAPTFFASFRPPALPAAPARSAANWAHFVPPL